MSSSEKRISAYTYRVIGSMIGPLDRTPGKDSDRLEISYPKTGEGKTLGKILQFMCGDTCALFGKCSGLQEVPRSDEVRMVATIQHDPIEAGTDQAPDIMHPRVSFIPSTEREHGTGRYLLERSTGANALSVCVAKAPPLPVLPSREDI